MLITVVRILSLRTEALDKDMDAWVNVAKWARWLNQARDTFVWVLK